MAVAYAIEKSANDKYYFNLKAKNGEVILTSQMYKAKQGAKTGLASVQAHCADANNFGKEVANDERVYFTLKAKNGEVIGTSQMYKTAQGRDNGIKSVQENGVSEVVTDNA